MQVLAFSIKRTIISQLHISNYTKALARIDKIKKYGITTNIYYRLSIINNLF